MAKSKRRRKRVSRDRVRQNARAGRGGQGWLTLPKGVSEWNPEKAGTYMIDIVPYEVRTTKHPDGIEDGVLWWKHPFKVHHGVGIKNESIACPESIGKNCPICEERAKLAQNYDENEERIKAIQAQRLVAYNILDPDDADSVCVFAISRGKFPSTLETELDEGPEENLNFYDVTDEGRTIKARFSKDQFMGRDFLTCTRIDFAQRDEMDEDEVLEKTVELSEIFNVPSYDELKSKFLELDDLDDEEEEEETEEEETEEEETEEEETEEEEEETEEEEEETEPAPKKKVKTKKSRKKKTSKKSSKPECPEGGVFGQDIDEFEACDECELWDKCDEEFDRLEEAD